MSLDINERVLAAFQAEHKEQLEGIRALLAELESDGPRHRPECIDEAFRLAHSLKGGARVCDLRPAETLAHRLENVFEQVRSGSLEIDKGVVTTVNRALDAIEDLMAAIGRNEEPGIPHEAFAAVERLVGGRQPDDDAAPRLLSAFCRECPQYLDGLGRFATALENEDSELTQDELDEAYRLVHNLSGSAHAAEVASVEEAGDVLESLVVGLRDQVITPGTAAAAAIRQHLGTVERELERLSESCREPGPAEPSDTEGTDEHVPAPRPAGAAQETSSEPARPAGSAWSSDTVRISTESLDRLLTSSRQLMTEIVRQEQLSVELEQLRRHVDEMKRERESIRRVAAASLHRLTLSPEFHRLASYFETVDRGVQSLARSTWQLCTAQKRNAWLLQSRGHRIQQEVRHARMVPAEAVYQSLRKLVRDLAKEQGKQIEFRVAGFDVRADRMVFQRLKDPLIHMLRNCIVHGVESPDERVQAGKNATCQVDLRIETVGNRLTIEVDDDGRGIDRDLVARRAVERGLISRAEIAQCSAQDTYNLVFQSGFSTSDQVTEIAGRGMGLSVVRDAVTRLQGDVHVCPKSTSGTKFRISVPLCVSTHRLLLVSAGNQTYAIPLHGIERLLHVESADVETLEDRPVVTFRDQLVPLVSLTGALGVAAGDANGQGEALKFAVLKSGTRLVAVSVDAFLAERDLLIHDLEGAAARGAYLGAVVLQDGTVALVLNPAELLDRAARPALEKIDVAGAAPKAELRTPRVLVVDDSFTTRTLEKSILEANGYSVGIAVDGAEALHRLISERYDLVISDIEMPHMDGFALLERIKHDDRLSSIPVILVTSRTRREDREKGLDLGAEAYIVKRRFDHQSLLSTIRQLVDVQKLKEP